MDKSNSTRELKRREFLGSIGAAGAALMTGAEGAASTPNQTLQRIRALLTGKDPVIWVFTGDSITHGAIHTMGWRSYPEIFAERIRWEIHRMRDVVINTGIAGDNTGGLVKDIDWRLLQFKPQVISVMMGMNDCIAGVNGREKFRSNLGQIIDAAEAHNAQVILNTTNPMYAPGPDSDKRLDLPAYNDIIREVAGKRGTALMDHHAHWLAVKKYPNELLYWLSDGAFHPNEYGHREMANLIFNELGIYDSTSLTGRMFVPQGPGCC